MSNLAPADIAGLKADSTLMVKEQPGLNIVYLAYNSLQPPLDKVKVRQALNMAINQTNIKKTVYEAARTDAKNAHTADNEVL